MSDLKPVVVRGKSLGKYSGSTIYLTQELFENFSQEELDGITYLSALQSGRLIKGFKHLMETLLNQDPKNILVLTNGESKRYEKQFFINFEDYRKMSSRVFFPIY